jgi:predicted HTH domain antitoxin
MSSPPVEVDVPEPLRSALLDRVGSLSRWGWEALVLEAVREGLLSRGQAGELLGLSFHEREAFFARRGLAYDLSEEELQRERADAEQIFDQ